MKSYIQIIKAITARLEKAGIEAARTESELIICELTGYSRPELSMRWQEPFPDALSARLEIIVARREQREPLQYILGHAYFMNLKLRVTPAVLIPRPETELMVERVCRTAPENATILDIGTGSGAVALAIADERPDLKVTAVDISPEALRIAANNREHCRLENVELLQSDLFSRLGNRRFDYITANLPYVSENEYVQLMPEVRDFEPIQALVAPQDGLELILKCAAAAPDHLNAGGSIIFEIGLQQAQRLKQALTASGRFGNIVSIQDYSSRERFVNAELIPRPEE